MNVLVVLSYKINPDKSFSSLRTPTRRQYFDPVIFVCGKWRESSLFI